eukprot:1320822-Rhodomonas_salina.2
MVVPPFYHGSTSMGVPPYHRGSTSLYALSRCTEQMRGTDRGGTYRGARVPRARAVQKTQYRFGRAYHEIAAHVLEHARDRVREGGQIRRQYQHLPHVGQYQLFNVTAGRGTYSTVAEQKKHHLWM